MIKSIVLQGEYTYKEAVQLVGSMSKWRLPRETEARSVNSSTLNLGDGNNYWLTAGKRPCYYTVFNSKEGVINVSREEELGGTKCKMRVLLIQGYTPQNLNKVFRGMPVDTSIQGSYKLEAAEISISEVLSGENLRVVQRRNNENQPSETVAMFPTFTLSTGLCIVQLCRIWSLYS